MIEWVAKVAQSVAGIYAPFRLVNRRIPVTFRAGAEESAESSDDPCHPLIESGVTDGARVIAGEPADFGQPAIFEGRIALLKSGVTIALKHLHEKLHWQGPNSI